MAQADGVVANGTGSAVRSDINGQYAALWSNHSGSTEPSSGKVAYQFWADTNTNIFKIRNAANNAWINLFTLAGGIDVDAASNFNEDVTFTGDSSKNAVWDKSDGALEFADNAKAVFGGGGDFSIFHDSSKSYIQNSTGNLEIQSDTFWLEDKTNGHGMIHAVKDGAVSLYYDNVTKLQTTSDGCTITDDGGYQLTLNRSGSATQQAGLLFLDGSDEYARIISWSGNVLIGCGVGSGAYENAIHCEKNGDVQVFHDGSEKFRSHSTGLLVNRTNNDGSAPFQVNEGSSLGVSVATSSTNGKKLCEFKNPNGQVGYIETNDSTTTYSTSSDYRLKENEVAISDGITRLKTLKPYRFNFKANSSKTLDGFFAHEVTPAVPEAVSGEKDGTEMQGIDHSKLVPLLTAAMKELVGRVEALETA